MLIVFGVIHFSLLWHGDILFLYGVFGLNLLAFMFRKNRTLVVWAWVLWGVSLSLLAAVSLLTWLAEVTGVELEGFTNNLDAVMANGTFAEAITPRLELWTVGASGGVLLQGFSFLQPSWWGFSPPERVYWGPTRQTFEAV